jgi:hypothetical protein
MQLREQGGVGGGDSSQEVVRREEEQDDLSKVTGSVDDGPAFTRSVKVKSAATAEQRTEVATQENNTE